MRAAASTLRIGARAAAVCAVAAAIVAGPTQASAGGSCPGANANPNDISAGAARAATLCLLNQQRRAYGLEILQTPDERRIRELFRDGRDPLPKEHK